MLVKSAVIALMSLKLCNCFVFSVAISPVFVDIWALFPVSFFVAYISYNSVPPVIILSAVKVFVLFNVNTIIKLI